MRPGARIYNVYTRAPAYIHMYTHYAAARDGIIYRVCTAARARERFSVEANILPYSAPLLVSLASCISRSRPCFYTGVVGFICHFGLIDNEDSNVFSGGEGINRIECVRRYLDRSFWCSIVFASGFLLVYVRENSNAGLYNINT